MKNNEKQIKTMKQQEQTTTIMKNGIHMGRFPNCVCLEGQKGSYFELS